MDLKRRFFAVILATVLSSSLYAQSSGAPTWKIYYDSAQSFWNKDWKRVISLLSRAEKSALSDLGIYDDNYLTIVNDLGLAYARNNEFSSAEKLFTKIIGIKTESGNASGSDYINTVINLGDVLAAQGQIQPATKLYKKLISTTAEITSKDYWRVANNLLQLYEANNYLDSALLLSDKLKSGSRADLKENSLISAELTLISGRLTRKLRKYEQSKVILETLAHSLQTNREPKGFLLYVRTLQEIGLLSLETGAINNAEKNLLQCFRLLKSGNTTDEGLLVEVLNSLASTYERLHITDKALAYYQDAMNLCHQLYGTTDVSSLTIKSNIAGIHLNQGELATAITSYEDIFKTLKTSRSGVFSITVLNNLATAYRKNNQFPKATERLNEATKLINENKLDNEDLAAVVLNNRAVLYTALAEPEQAIVHFEKAYAIKRTLFGENSISLKDLAGNMAVVYWALRKPDSAIPLFKKSIALAIRQVRYIFPNLSEDEQIQFYQKTKEDFERFNAVAFQNAKDHPDLLKDVFNNQITLKSILFFTQQHRQVLINEKRDSLLTQQYEMLRAKREQLGHFYQLSLKDLATAETSTTALEKEIDQLEKSISLKTSATISERMLERETSWDEIQKIMQPDQGLIELIRFRKYDFKAVVENNTDRIRFGFTDSIFYAGLITTKATTNSPQLVLIKDGNNMETRFL
ncbi:MAG TPA: tetratricopeptide repeat protein, partial [Chryseolinea sp.]|nr:tetratricopeptide repeat protein [Chryseolinea sp.]